MLRPIYMLENWNGNKAEWPLLTKDAPILASVSVSVLILRISALYQYLLPDCPVPIPGTNDQQYRFSTAGQIATDRQNRIGPKRIEVLSFVNENVRLSNFDC